MIITNMERYMYMIKGIGIDIVEIERIKQIIERQPRFPERILTAKEKVRYDQYKNEQRRIEYIAGRFAAKEAAAKATGRGIGELSFQHIEITTNKQGAPKIKIDHYEHETVHLTISHSKQYAVAQVIIEEI